MTVHGKWMVTISTPMGERNGVLDFEVEGSTLSGKLSADGYAADISDGIVDGIG